MEVTANSMATTSAAIDADNIGMQVHISSAMQVGGGTGGEEVEIQGDEEEKVHDGDPHA